MPFFEFCIGSGNSLPQWEFLFMGSWIVFYHLLDFFSAKKPLSELVDGVLFAKKPVETVFRPFMYPMSGRCLVTYPVHRGGDGTLRLLRCKASDVMSGF